MSEIIYYDSDGNVLTAYYQWDVDQKLQIDGIDDIQTVDMIHFGNKTLPKALVVPHTVVGTRIVVDVPNLILQYSDAINIYIYCNTANDGQRTMHAGTIIVYPRQKPEDYEYEENIDYVNWVELAEEARSLIDDLRSYENGNTSRY